jgi:DMSO reductase anchor subunit
LTFLVPFLALALQGFFSGLIAGLLATVVALAPGLVIERWRFFAEAKQKVRLYYGADAV